MAIQTTTITERVEKNDPYSAVFEQARRNADSRIAEMNASVEKVCQEELARKKAQEPSTFELLRMPFARLFSRTPNVND